MKPHIDTAIAIWRTDNGYRKINSFLIKSSSVSDYQYHNQDNTIIEYDGKTYNTIDVINVIKTNMKTSDNNEIYYRGGSIKSKSSFIKKSFISVASDEEQAQQFVDGDCCLFKITVDPSVKRYPTGIESETLLENGLFWEYLGKKGKYHVVNIKQPPEENLDINLDINLETDVITTNEPQELNKHELDSWLEEYKEDCSLLELDPTAEDFVEFIKSYKNVNIPIEKANEMLTQIGGKNRKQKIKKRNKKTKRYSKNNKRRINTRRLK